MKKFVAMLLALAMCFSLMTACSGNETPSNSNDPAENNSQNVAETTDTYTYNSYSTALGTNWNPHTWEMNADQSIMDYLLAPLTDLTIKDSTTGEYQWIFVAATGVEDVTAEHQDDLVKYGCAETDATSGYVYEISLRPEMCWEDGTPINADTYVYSMQQLLSPEMKNYRANNYYSGESAIAGAEAYFFSGDETIKKSVAALGYASNDEAIAAGETLLLDMWGFYGLEGATDAEGNECPQWVAIDDTHVYVDPADGSEVSAADIYGAYAPYFEVGVDYAAYVSIETANDNYGASFDTVGLYKVDDYTIRYVCATAYDYYYFLTSCTSNWIVNEELYEACKDTTGSLVTSTYCTSADTSISCYAYRIDSLQDDKQLVLVQNENYWEYTKNEDGTLSSESFFEVDGEVQPQFPIQKIVIDVMTDDAAKLAFLSGDLDDWNPAADEVVNYSTSDQLYQVDETYTMRLFFHTNLDTLKSLDQIGNTNSVVLSSTKFRNAMSLAIDRAEFVTATAGYKAAYSMLNSLYFYDVYEDPTSIYRNSDQAKQAICNIYGVEYGGDSVYATLDEAYESINGYNLTEAKRLFTEACQELVAEGLYTEGAPIVIELAWKAGPMDSTASQQVSLLNKQLNAALEGTGFGTIELKAIDNLDSRYEDVANGVYAMGWGAWGGAAFYPFTIFRVYCDDDYVSFIHESGCWDPSTETLTLNVNGEDVTMTWKEWSVSMTGVGPYAEADNETKLNILSAIEENFIELYYCIPVCSTTACSMLSYKLGYYTENYSIMYGFGGIRLMHFNYTDAEWADYVASQGGTVAY